MFRLLFLCSPQRFQTRPQSENTEQAIFRRARRTSAPHSRQNGTGWIVCCEPRRKDSTRALLIARRERLGLFRSASVSRKRRRKRRSRIPNYRFIPGSCGPTALGYLKVGLCFLAYAFRRGVKRRMCEDHFILEGQSAMTDRRAAPRTKSSPAPTRPSFSTAPRERFMQPNLSHVRKTLESGIPVLPCATSLDVVGQWLLCCAGASPTESPCTA
jgi:hypothetical protein